MKKLHKQCLLEKCGERQVSWIPEEYAKNGKLLEIINKTNRTWTKGWKVKEVYGSIDSNKAIKNSNELRIYREIIDI